mgnify:CR=1 FL=1
MNHIAHERMDSVSGFIIGGAYVGWQVVYDGRAQSGKWYSDTEGEAMYAASARIEGLKSEFCGHPCYLYPDPTAWRIRLWG